jgi:hypothetical protein
MWLWSVLLLHLRELLHLVHLRNRRCALLEILDRKTITERLLLLLVLLLILWRVDRYILLLLLLLFHAAG